VKVPIVTAYTVVLGLAWSVLIFRFGSAVFDPTALDINEHVWPMDVRFAWAATIATPAFGWCLGVGRRVAGVPIAALFGTALILVSYINLWNPKPDTEPIDDNAAAAGSVILGAPKFAVIFGFLAVGAIARLAWTLGRRRSVARRQPQLVSV
jgi:hypothetical protein